MFVVVIIIAAIADVVVVVGERCVFSEGCRAVAGAATRGFFWSSGGVY